MFKIGHPWLFFWPRHFLWNQWHLSEAWRLIRRNGYQITPMSSIHQDKAINMRGVIRNAVNYLVSTGRSGKSHILPEFYKKTCRERRGKRTGKRTGNFQHKYWNMLKSSHLFSLLQVIKYKKIMEWKEINRSKFDLYCTYFLLLNENPVSNILLTL